MKKFTFSWAFFFVKQESSNTDFDITLKGRRTYCFVSLKFCVGHCDNVTNANNGKLPRKQDLAHPPFYKKETWSDGLKLVCQIVFCCCKRNSKVGKIQVPLRKLFFVFPILIFTTLEWLLQKKIITTKNYLTQKVQTLNLSFILDCLSIY